MGGRDEEVQFDLSPVGQAQKLAKAPGGLHRADGLKAPRFRIETPSAQQTGFQFPEHGPVSAFAAHPFRLILIARVLEV